MAKQSSLVCVFMSSKQLSKLVRSVKNQRSQKNFAAPEERNVGVLIVHCAPLELKTFSLAT